MSIELAREWIQLLKDGGPYAVLFFLGIAYVLKDRYVQQLHAQIVQLAVNQIQAVDGAKSAIDSLANKLIDRK